MFKKTRIGLPMNKKGVLLNICILLAYTLFWSFVGIYLCIGNTLKLSILLRIIIMLLITFILLIIQIPLIGATQRIEFSQESIEYYYVSGWSSQFKEVIRILKGNLEQPSIQLFIDDIDKVNISYRQTHGGYGLTGYMVSFSFLMKDHTMITLSPENMTKTENGVYIRLIDLLSSKNIKIYDQFHLKDGLIRDSYYFQDYIQKMKGIKSHD